MTGAPLLAFERGQRAGAGYVRLSAPGVGAARCRRDRGGRSAAARDRWAATVLARRSRFKALVVGPGLGRSEETAKRARLARAVAGAAWWSTATALTMRCGVRARTVSPATVLTPHDGEFERWPARRPGDDRIAQRGRLASGPGATVLLKGDHGGRVARRARCSGVDGDARLATAGTGDVLAGIIGALLAQGLAPFAAAARSAPHVHGAAAELGPGRGLVAGDLPDLLPAVLASA